jgi:hypothetical protein
MISRFGHSSVNLALLALVLSVSGICSLVVSARVAARETFSDVEPDYWAQPFIRTLAERDIITGYPDGTYRPERPLDRDEFAAIIRQAFSQEREKTIPSGSIFEDIPANYWAAPPIEEAYEMGFMKGFPNELFRPREEVTKVDALIALSRGLEWTYDPAVPTERATTTITPAPAAKPQVTPNRLVFPLAMTALMQPVLQVVSPEPREPVSTAPATVPQQPEEPSAPSAAEIVRSYYADAEQIPEYAVEDIATATLANIVVNYPEVQFLNPSEVLSRGVAAALIYQTLVHQDKAEPIPTDVEAHNYIVNPTSESDRTARVAE